MRDGAVAYARGYGSADLEHGIPNSVDSVFRVASTSKQFTAASIQLLAQDGVLTLDDDVRKWIPELTCSAGTVTLRHLLHHTGGLRSYLWNMSLAGYGDADYYTEEDALAMLFRQRGVNFAPGERFEYSNTGYFLLSIVVERASGKSLREFAEERIFEPLGMTNSHFHNDHTEVVPNRAMGYRRTGDGFALNMTQLEMCGDGALFTTVLDLTKWIANFREPKVGGEAWLDTMTTAGVLNDGEVLDYASGLGVDEWKGVKQVAHGGAFVGFRAEALHIPELGFGVVCLSNLAEFDPSARCAEIRDLLLGAEPEDEVVTEEAEVEPSGSVEIPQAAAKAFDGIWLEQTESRLPRVMTVAARNGRLRVRGSEVGLRFEPLNEKEFFSERSGARLRLDEAGTRLVLDAKGEAPANFERAEPFEPDSEALAEYAGDYWSEELQVVYRLSIREDDLVHSIRGREISKLKPVLKDRFKPEFPGALRFERDEQGLRGFVLDATGSRGVGGFFFARITY